MGNIQTTTANYLMVCKHLHLTFTVEGKITYMKLFKVNH